MGVPAFYRWLTSRYPKCVVLLEEQEPVVVDDVEIPIDCTQESPNGHVDNLYLDMNGIIHPCFHPEDKLAPLTFEQCFKDIFAYIDRIMAIVRPRKLLFMAIDGVAPRAKMNQQRSRRFKSAKDAQDKLREEKRIRAELQAQGMKVRSAKGISETSALGDSNIITPGTAFMAKLSIALQYYIHQRINTQPAWKPLTVMLSDANAPGEGEHKIMEYIREQRGRPGWHPNLTHVVSGLDADLIHLALATHEPHFHILREVVFGPSAGDAPEGGAKPKVPYQYLKISILRDYLELEFNDVQLPFHFDKERIYDDFVFLCFFVGNDFLPHSPTLEIREGGIDLLMTIYKRQLPFLGGWLCDGAKVNLGRVEVIIREVARCEERILQKRMRIMKNQESKRNSAVKRPMSVDTVTPPRALVTNPAVESSKGTPKKQRTEEEDNVRAESLLEINSSTEQATPVNPQKVWTDLMSVSPAEKAKNTLPEIDPSTEQQATPVNPQKVWTDLMSVSPAEKAQNILPEIDPSTEQTTPVNSQKVWTDLMSVSPAEKAKNTLLEASTIGSDEAIDEVEEMVQKRLKDSAHEKADMFDSMVQHGEAVGFGMQGWKERYYRMKIPDVLAKERTRVVKDMVEKFVEGLMWVMAYYYEGVASWTWYYPYHYAPFASDMIKITHIQPNFQLGEPFLPVNQLMAVLPAASRFCLPQCLQHLFVNHDSPIIDFYPENFKCDMNGKRFAWQAVVLLPFIDEERLIQTTKEYFGEFTEEEKERNKRKLTQFYVGEQHPLTEFIKSGLTFDDSTKVVKLQLDPEKSDGLNGHLCVTENHCPETFPAPFELGEDITQNRVVMGSFLNPPHQKHLCQLMPRAEEESTGLTIYDIPPEQEPWHEHPRAGNNPPHRSPHPRPHFAIDRDAAHRFVVHSVSGPRFKDEAPQRSTPQKFALRASAPEFVPEHVTRMAMQMTGHLGNTSPSICPPPVPPDAVTAAAIRLSERVRRQPMVGNMQPMFPMTPQQQQPQHNLHSHYSPLMMPQFPAGFPSFMPQSPMQGGQQPHIRGPAFFEPRPQAFGNVRTPQPHSQRPSHGHGGNFRTTPSQRGGDPKRPQSNKRKK